MNNSTISTVNNVTTHLTESEVISGELVNKALDFLGNPSKVFTPDRDADLRPLAKAVSEMGLAESKEIFKKFGAASNATGEEGMAIFRRILGKIMTSATRDLHFRVTGIEKKQQRYLSEGKEFTKGEIETYTYPAFDADPHLVSDYYQAVIDLKSDVDQWNQVLVDMLGWNSGTTQQDYQIPFCHAVVDTPENWDKAPVDREYRPVYTISEALVCLDRVNDRKTEAKKAAAKSMFDALMAA